MIVVRVELWSARTGERTIGDPHPREFGSKGVLDREHVQRRGRVERFPSQRLHVWNLVAEMLGAMGYRR